MMWLVAGVRGLGAASGFANKPAGRALSGQARVAPCHTRNPQAGDRKHPRGRIRDRRRAEWDGARVELAPALALGLHGSFSTRLFDWP